MLRPYESIKNRLSKRLWGLRGIISLVKSMVVSLYNCQGRRGVYPPAQFVGGQAPDLPFYDSQISMKSNLILLNNYTGTPPNLSKDNF